jgi:hypothetical protein
MATLVPRWLGFSWQVRRDVPLGPIVEGNRPCRACPGARGRVRHHDIQREGAGEVVVVGY